MREEGRESESEVWGEVMEVMEEITDETSPSCVLSLCLLGAGIMVLLELHESHLNPAIRLSSMFT